MAIKGLETYFKNKGETELVLILNAEEAPLLAGRGETGVVKLVVAKVGALNDKSVKDALVIMGTYEFAGVAL